MKALVPTLFGLGALAYGIHAIASESEVTRHYSLPLDGISEVRIDGGVGTMEFVHTDGDTVNVVLDIEGKRRMWVMGKHDVSDIELDVRTRGDRLILSLDDDDHDEVEVHWRVELPSVAHTRIHLGVGEISGDFEDTELSLDMGVGAADISLARAGAGRVEASAGVGSAQLRGAKEVVSTRAIVSEETLGYGEGIHEADLSVGVGEIKVTLTDRSFKTAQSW